MHQIIIYHKTCIGASNLKKEYLCTAYRAPDCPGFSPYFNSCYTNPSDFERKVLEGRTQLKNRLNEEAQIITALPELDYLGKVTILTPDAGNGTHQFKFSDIFESRQCLVQFDFAKIKEISVIDKGRSSVYRKLLPNETPEGIKRLMCVDSEVRKGLSEDNGLACKGRIGTDDTLTSFL